MAAGDRYFSWRPDSPNGAAPFDLHYRADPDGNVLVGARLDGGLIHFMEDGEAERHVRAIWVAAEAEVQRIRSEAFTRLPDVPDEALRVRMRIRAAEAAEGRVERYLSDVRKIMASREQEIGVIDADLAPALVALIGEVTP